MPYVDRKFAPREVAERLDHQTEIARAVSLAAGRQFAVGEAVGVARDEDALAASVAELPFGGPGSDVALLAFARRGVADHGGSVERGLLALDPGAALLGPQQGDAAEAPIVVEEREGGAAGHRDAQLSFREVASERLAQLGRLVGRRGQNQVGFEIAEGLHEAVALHVEAAARQQRGDCLAARRLGQHEQVAAARQVGVERLQLGRGEGLLRIGDHHDVDFGGHGRTLGERYFADLEALVDEGRARILLDGEAAETAVARVRCAALAVPREEAHRRRRVEQLLENGRDFGLGGLRVHVFEIAQPRRAAVGQLDDADEGVLLLAQVDPLADFCR